MLKGLITAAGLGKRLGAVTHRTNKGLLIVKQKPLLIDTLEKFKEAGIKDVLVVTGYQSALLRRKIGKRARTVFNPFYRVSGILGSFWMARHYLENGPFLFTTSDHFFHPSVLENCLKNRSDICLVIQQKDRYTPEDSKVILNGDRIIDLGKNLPVERADGEFAGMAYFSQKGSQYFFKTLQNKLENGYLKGYMTDVLKEVNKGIPLGFSTCPEGSRIEIDSVHDLVTARRLANNSNRRRRDVVQI